jgi:hypothetical protein
MKSKFLITLLSLASLNSMKQINAYGEIIQPVSQFKKQQIDSMLNDIAEIIEPGKKLNFDKKAQDLYTKYRYYKSFRELLFLFKHMEKNCDGNYAISKTVHPFSFVIQDLKEYLIEKPIHPEKTDGCDLYTYIPSEETDECAIKLYTRYSGTVEFLNMRSLFKKIAKIQDAEKHNCYKDALEAIKNLKRYINLGIGRHK